MPKNTNETNLARKPKRPLSDQRYKRLVQDVQQLVTAASAAADQGKVNAYWQLGRRITREQLETQAGYHNAILRDLSRTSHMAVRTLQYAVKFHRLYPKCPTGPLNWLHYRVLLDRCPSETARAHYEALAVREGLVSRDLAMRIVEDQRTRTGETALPRPPEADYLYAVKVDEVIDGDTLDMIIDLGFRTKRSDRFRLADIDCEELPRPGARKARDFVYGRLLTAKTIVVQTLRSDLHGRYVAHLFYSDTQLPIAQCFRQGTHLNAELVSEGHAKRVG